MVIISINIVLKYSWFGWLLSTNVGYGLDVACTGKADLKKKVCLYII